MTQFHRGRNAPIKFSLAAFLIVLLVPILLPSIIITSIFGSSGSESTTMSLLDICLYHFAVPAEYMSDEYEWVRLCRDQIYALQNSDAFAVPADADDSEVQESRVKKQKASVILYCWWAEHQSTFLEDSDESYQSYADCISADDPTDDAYICSEDNTWLMLNETYDLNINDAAASIIVNSYSNVRVSSLNDLFPEYEENYMHYWGDGAEEVWARIYSNAAGNFQIYTGGDRYQCTDVAHWRFWMTYGKDWYSAGNGCECAANIVHDYPDEFYLSSVPAAGAVFSTQTYNHTGFIEKYDPVSETVWYTDGNISYGSNRKGIRINYKVPKSYFDASNTVYAVPKGGS